MKKNVAVALAGVLIVAVAGGWWSMSGSKSGPKNAKAPTAAGGPSGGGAPALVTLATAQKQDVPVTVQVNGSVVSLNSVDLRPQVTNTVSAVHVKEGQFVKAGQLLFSLDDRNDQANLARARAQQQKDEATMADLERQRAAVAADRAAVQSAQVALGYATLRAPIAGRIGAVNIYPGTLVQPTLSLVTITQLDPIAVSFPVPEGNLQDLLEAARSRSKVEALVTGRKEPLTGTLDFVDNTVDPTIGTVRAKAVFANADQSLWPGQFVGTRIQVRSLGGVTVVPAAALMMLSDGTSLYVVDEAKTATRRKVKTLHTFGTKVAVSGVEPGEQVVIEGSQNVRPGGKVRVDAKAPAAAPGAPAAPANGSSGVTPGSAASSDGTDAKPPKQERA
jgi:multidrug efflux pump subunit AcrA (membrane-fusion protein)